MFSESVIPLHDHSGSVRGVLDIDSPVKNRFSEEDREGLCEVVRIMEERLEF